MKVSREQLIADLKAVQPGLAKKEFVEQSTCFVFLDGFVGTYNEQIRMMKETILKGVTGAVPSSPLYNLLTKMKEDEVEIEVKDNVLSVSGKNKKAELPLDPEIKLPIQDMDEEVYKDEGWTELDSTFCDVVRTCAFSASRSVQTPLVTCIHITDSFIESTDNFRCTRIDFPFNGDDTNLLIPVGVMEDVIKYLPTSFKIGKNWLHFNNVDGVIFSCRLFVADEAGYPSLDKVLQLKGAQLKLPETLPEILDRVGVFITVKNVLDKFATIELKKGNMIVSAKGEGGKFNEKTRVRFDGKDFQFVVNVEFLADVFKLNPVAIVGENRMLFSSEGFKHVLSIAQVKV